MAVVTKPISFNTGVGTSVITVAHGLGAAPTFGILWTTGKAGTTEGVGRQTMLRSFGIFVSTTSRATIGQRSEDAAANMICDRHYRTDACLVEVTNGGTAGQLDVTTLDSTNIEFTPDVAFGTDIRVQGIVGCGTDNTFIGEIVMNTSTGTQDITAPGFTTTADQGFVLFMNGSHDPAPPVSAIDVQYSIGCATSSTSSKQWVFAGCAGDTDPTAQTLAYGRSGEIMVKFNALTTAIDTVMSFNGFITNGFQLNITDAPPAAQRVPYLIVKGGLWQCGNLLTQTDTTTDITVSGLPASPSTGLLMSVGRAESTSGTPTDNDEVSIGSVLNSTTEQASCSMDDDGAGTSAVSAGFSNDACYLHMDTTGALSGEMHCTSVDSTGWTFRMTDADPAQAFVGWLAAMNNAALEVTLPLATTTVSAGISLGSSQDLPLVNVTALLVDVGVGSGLPLSLIQMLALEISTPGTAASAGKKKWGPQGWRRWGWS